SPTAPSATTPKNTAFRRLGLGGRRGCSKLASRAQKTDPFADAPRSRNHRIGGENDDERINRMPVARSGMRDVVNDREQANCAEQGKGLQREAAPRAKQAEQHQHREGVVQSELRAQRRSGAAPDIEKRLAKSRPGLHEAVVLKAQRIGGVGLDE